MKLRPRRQQEAQREKSTPAEDQVRFQARLLDSVAEAVVATDLDGTVIYWNRAAELLYGWTAEEAIGRNVLTLTPAEDLKNQAAQIIDRLRAGECWSGEFKVRRRDGTVLPAEVTDSPIYDDSGRLAGIIGVSSDISRRKQLEEDLVGRERLLDAFFTAATAGMAILDHELRYVRINKTLAAMNGHPVEDHIGRGLREMLPHLTAVHTIVDQVARTGTPVFDLEISGETPAAPGSVRYWIGSWFPIRIHSDQRSGVGAIVVENTRRNQAEREVRETNERLQALSRRVLAIQELERRHLARELHDEIGQELTALKIVLQTRQRFSDPADFNKGLSECVRAVDDLLNQIRGLSLDLRPPLLDDLGLVPALEWFVEQQSGRTGLAIRLSVEPGLPRFDPSVETALYRIAQEALTNVARHSGAAAATVTIEVRDEAIWLLINDDGCGFDYAAAREEARRGESMGLLGMEERISSIGGTFKCVSSPDKGTSIRVAVPRRAPDIPPGERI